MTRVRSVTSSRNQQKPTNSSVKNRDGKRNYPSKNQEYITEPEELDIIEAILDNAISEMPEDVESLRGFFDFAEEQSEELTFKNGETYPLVITSYPEVRGQITGFTVAFADDPDRYVAGSKIMAGYEDDLEKRHKFSPKNLAEELGFDYEEKEQRKENTVLRSRNTEFSRKPRVKTEEEDFDSNTDEWEEQKQTQSRVRRRVEEKDSSKTKNNSNPNNKTEKDTSEEADSEDLLENEGVLGKVAKTRKTRPEPQSTRESSEKRNSSNSSKSFLKSRSKDAGEELGRFATQLANQGHEINGINLTGEILQAAIALGIITSAGIELLAKSLEEAREEGLEKRAEKIEEKIKDIVERMEEVTDDYQGLQQQAKGKNTAQEQVESRQTPNADQRPSLAETGDDVNKLSSELLSPKTKFIPPLNLNQNDSIDERLDRIEEYLDNLSKRLDRLEEKIAELKEQQDSKSAVGTQSPLSLTSEPALEKITRDSTQDSTIAEALVNFALAVEAKNNEEMSLGNNTLRVKNVGQGEILVSLKSEEDIEILRATKANGEWVSSESSERLDDDEKKKILSLPQSKEEVNTINTARHFVETLEESFPKHFKNSCDFQITGPGEREDVDVVLYSFQIDELKNGSKILEATDPKSALVFRAELREGYAPEIKKCDILTEEMEEVITVYEKEREKEKAELNRGTRTLNHRPSETNQDEEQL